MARSIGNGYTVEQIKQFWILINALAEKHEFLIFMGSPFDLPYYDTWAHLGWWRLDPNNSQLIIKSGFIEKIAADVEGEKIVNSI